MVRFDNKLLLGILVALAASCSGSKEKLQEESSVLLPLDESSFSLILGMPEDRSLTMSAISNRQGEVYWEYGTSSGRYTQVTDKFNCEPNVPVVAVFKGLTADTRYYYRTRFRPAGSQTEVDAGAEHNFHTQRKPGSSFVFTVEADEHMYDKKGSLGIYRISLNNQLLDQPDFMFSLGDTFGDDHNPSTITAAQLDQLHRYYRPLWGAVCHSVPLMLCLGNHEGENNYYLGKNPPDNLAVNGTLKRKYYYCNPHPDGFYSGNQESEPWGIGQPENYYAFTWGDALFVVMDVYRYQNADNPKPEGWDWTIGSTQYQWLRQTLESSKSKYRFVFAHHVRGEGRGAATLARGFEWGGYDQNGSNTAFAQKRPGWTKPIHQLFIDNKVTIFFQGHDHLFARETLDGITYQEVPMPSDSTYQIGILANADAYTSDIYGGTGHVRVAVSSANVKVDFVQALLPKDETASKKNRQSAFSYTLP